MAAAPTTGAKFGPAELSDGRTITVDAWERVEAQDLRPGDLFAPTRDLNRLATLIEIQSKGPSSRWLVYRIETSPYPSGIGGESRKRPRHTAKFWRVNAYSVRGADRDPHAARARRGKAAIKVGTPDWGANGADAEGLATDAADAIANILHEVARCGLSAGDVEGRAWRTFEGDREDGPVTARVEPADHYRQETNL